MSEKLVTKMIPKAIAAKILRMRHGRVKNEME